MAVFLIVMKMLLVHQAYGAALLSETTIATIINYISVLASDFMIVGLIFVGAFLNAVIRRRWFKWYVNITALLLMLLYVCDMFSIYYFQSRFYMMDLLQFFSLRNSANYVIYPLVWGIIFIAVLFVLFLMVQKWFPVIRKKNMHLRAALVFFAMCVLFSGVNLLSNTSFHFRNNVLAINIQEIVAVASASDRDALPWREIQSYESYFVPMVWRKRQWDVIVLFAESFSTVDSKRSGGIHDYLTGFDTIAADGMTYTNFIANGCTSETAHIALLQWVEPREVLQGSSESYKNYKTYTEQLPQFFNNLWYNTVFLSTAPLSFLHQRDFLKKVGFSQIIGEEAFSHMPHYVFNAAPDESLYQRALRIVRENDKKKPLFLSLQTISSHKPYNSPAGTSERTAFAYSDQALLNFYQQLKADWFFSHGTLIIVGDHRKMEPLEHKEFKKFGTSANGRAVLAVVGPDIAPNSYSTDIIQHIDLFSSLKYLYGTGTVTLNSRFNELLGNYEGRKQAIRYCQYVEKQYIATNEDNDSWTIGATTDKQNLAYINSYKKFQQYTGSLTKDMAELEQLKSAKWITIIWHQGAPMIEAPNSYSSFIRAKEQWADGVEFDISLTKDNYNVVLHGPDIGRTQCKNSEGKKNVVDFTLKEIKDNCVLFNGEPVLTLTEALQKTQWLFQYYFVDVKVYDQWPVVWQMKDVVETVKKLRMEDKVIISSYDTTGNMVLSDVGKKVTLAWDTFNPSEYLQMKDTHYQYFMVPYMSFQPTMVSYLKSQKVEPVAYTVNNIQDVKKLYTMGIRMFMTDNVPMIVEWLRSEHIAPE